MESEGSLEYQVQNQTLWENNHFFFVLFLLLDLLVGEKLFIELDGDWAEVAEVPFVGLKDLEEMLLEKKKKNQRP